MLLGQNVNSYGKGLEYKITFAELLQKINEVDGLRRIRFMTSNPKDLTDDLIDSITACDKVCRHLHLPLQSGSDAVLKKMNRKYTKDGYMELIGRAREKSPGISVTTDIIVGFPGETEDDFNETLDVVSRANFSNAFTFIYSKRSGTPAAEMDGQIDKFTAGERFGRLTALLNEKILELNSALVGETLEVLAEEQNKDQTLLTGRTSGNTPVHFAGGRGLIGELINVKITGCKTFYLTGEAEIGG